MSVNKLDGKFPINTDLANERKNATINTEEFAIWWHNGINKLNERRELENLFFNDADFNDVANISFLSHKQLYEHTIKNATKFINKFRSWQNQKQSESNEKLATLQLLYDFRKLLTGSVGIALFPQNFPLRLHFSMFIPAIINHGNQEQQLQWLEKAWQMNGLIGTYAQTELGHGTFLRGLETRADYDVKNEEFILNTPTLSAYKWWPGGMGHTANIAIILAQLYIKGKNYGLHSFLVRIRNEVTHMPENGIDVGEIGPKLGSNGVNNGFLGLKNVRIPRNQMLMKHAQVLPDGKFKKGAVPLLIYGTMVYTRVMIINDVSFSLLQAATIATRYSIVRHQSHINSKQPEVKILDHLTQQAKIIPQIAKGIVYRMAADKMWTLYQVVAKQLEIGNNRNLAELHALSCCLKSVCSQEASDGVEILRKACGGHGYLTSSNFTNIYGLTVAACTYEGENTVLLLQTAKFLIKNYIDGLKRKVLPKTVNYLRFTGHLKWQTNNLLTYVKILEISATDKTRQAFEYQRIKQKQNRNLEIGTNMASLKLIDAAKLHGRAFLVRVAYENIQLINKQLAPQIAPVLTAVLELFILNEILDNLGDIILACSLNARQINELQKRYEEILLLLRPNVIAIVDGFDFHDRVLNSTLGYYDGCVYERLMEDARKNPLNQEPVNETFDTHLKPFMQAKL